MIISGPEFDKFVVEPGMEIERFDPKLIKEIFLNHPYKFLIYHLNKHPPNYSRWVNEDINDFYFKMLDDYTRYGIAFDRKFQLFPDNNLYVFEIKDKNFSLNIKNNIYSNKKLSKNENENEDNKIKYDLLYRGYDKKTLLFNKVKKIDLSEYDTGKKPLSRKEKEKRNFIRKQKNKYLQVAMMDPDVYNNDELFEYLISSSNEYNAEMKYNFPFMYIDEINDAEYLKKKYKKQLNIIKKLYYRINVETYDYITKID